MNEWDRICALEAKVGTLESVCRTLSAKVRALEATGKRVPETRNTEKIRYDRYGREITESPPPRGFNVPI
jgi:hypothetical protein